MSASKHCERVLLHGESEDPQGSKCTSDHGDRAAHLEKQGLPSPVTSLGAGCVAPSSHPALAEV